MNDLKNCPNDPEPASEPGSQQARFVDFTFPNYDRFPAAVAQKSLLSVVALYIGSEFSIPELEAGFRRVCELAVGMPMPEASMYENDDLVFWKDDIWMTRQFGRMKSKAQSHSMKNGSNEHLRACIFAANPGHVPASFFDS